MYNSIKNNALNICGLKEVVRTLFEAFTMTLPNGRLSFKAKDLPNAVKYAEETADSWYVLEYEGVHYRVTLNADVLTNIFKASVIISIETDCAGYYHTLDETFMKCLEKGLNVIA